MMMLRRIPHAPGFPSLHREMSRLFDSLAGDLPRNASGAETRTWAPPVDTVETPEALLVRVELPGIEPEKIDISVQDGVLEIKAERTEERTEERTQEGSGWNRFERVSGTFRRLIELPMPVEVDRIEAASRHGLLTVTLPKKPEILPRKIPVK